MIERRELFPNVIELNFQARRRLGCSIYLVYDGNDWLLIDIGYEDTIPEIIELIRQMDFPLAGCKYLVASHADVDALDLSGVVDDGLATEMAVAAADTVKRVLAPPAHAPDWLADPGLGRSPFRIGRDRHRLGGRDRSRHPRLDARTPQPRPFGADKGQEAAHV